jgi:hypothetical protein
LLGTAPGKRAFNASRTTRTWFSTREPAEHAGVWRLELSATRLLVDRSSRRAGVIASGIEGLTFSAALVAGHSRLHASARFMGAAVGRADRFEDIMSEPGLVDITGRLQSPAATPGHCGLRYPADPPPDSRSMTAPPERFTHDVRTRQCRFRARGSCLSGEAPVTPWTALTLQRSAVSRTRAILLIVSANWLIALSASFSPDPVATRWPPDRGCQEDRGLPALNSVARPLSARPMTHPHWGGSGCWTIEPAQLRLKVLAEPGVVVVLSAMVAMARVPAMLGGVQAL